jgi:O-antigen/teichoic acid export membrane protein
MNDELPAGVVAKAPRSGVILRNVIHLGLGQVVSTALGFFLTAALARMLGPAEFGIYIVVLTIFAFVFSTIDWGQATYVVSHTARGRSDEPHFIGSALLIRAVGILCGAVVAWIIALGFGYRDAIWFLAPMAILIALPASFAQAFGYVFRARDRMDVDQVNGIVGKVVGLVATLLALYWGGKVFEVLLAGAIGGLCWLGIALYQARRLDVKVAAPTYSGLQEQLRLGAPIAVYGFTFALHPLVDVWVLSRLTAPEVVGWYGAARAILGFVVAPAAILGSASFPEVSRVCHSVPDLRRVLATNARLLLVVGAFAATFFFTFADHLVITIYGRGQFEKTAQLLRAFVPFLPLLFLGLLLGNATAAVGKNKEMAFAKIIFLVVTTVIAWFLIDFCQKRFGNGAIALMFVSGLAEVWMLACFAYWLPRGSLTRSMFVDVSRAMCAVAFTLVPLWLVQPLPLWLLVPLYFSLFTAVAWTLNLVAKADIDKIAELIFSRSVVTRKPPA